MPYIIDIYGTKTFKFGKFDSDANLTEGYLKGDVAYLDGIVYSATSDIPAGTPFRVADSELDSEAWFVAVDGSAGAINDSDYDSDFTQVRHDFAAADSEIDSDITQVKHDYQAADSDILSSIDSDIAKLRHDYQAADSEIDSDIAQVKHDYQAADSEIDSDIAQVRHDFAAADSDLKSDLDSDLAQIRHDFAMDDSDQFLINLADVSLYDSEFQGNLLLADGSVLVYDSDRQKFIPGGQKLGNLQDVVLGTLSEGHSISWDSDSSTWINKAPSGVGYSMQVDTFTVTDPSNLDFALSSIPVGDVVFTRNGVEIGKAACIIDYTTPKVTYDPTGNYNDTFDSDDTIQISYIAPSTSTALSFDVAVSTPEQGSVLSWSGVNNKWNTINPSDDSYLTDSEQAIIQFGGGPNQDGSKLVRYNKNTGVEFWQNYFAYGFPAAGQTVTAGNMVMINGSAFEGYTGTNTFNVYFFEVPEALAVYHVEVGLVFAASTLGTTGWAVEYELISDGTSPDNATWATGTSVSSGNTSGATHNTINKLVFRSPGFNALYNYNTKFFGLRIVSIDFTGGTSGPLTIDPNKSYINIRRIS